MDLTQKDLKRLDHTHEMLRLLGAVLGRKALLELVVESESEQIRVSAAKELVKLGEDPDRIVERLRSMPFQDMSMSELEALVENGELDTDIAIQALQGDQNGSETEGST